MNTIVYASRAFADTIKTRSQQIRMGPEIQWPVSSPGDRCEDTEKCREGDWMGAATRQGRQAKDASNPWKLEEARMGSSREPPEEQGLVTRSFQTLAPDCMRFNVCCSKPPSV